MEVLAALVLSWLGLCISSPLPPLDSTHQAGDDDGTVAAAHRRKSRKTEDLLSRLHHYELVVPVALDHRGSFLSHHVGSNVVERHRHRRSLGGQQIAQNMIIPDESVFYRLSAYGKDFHLNLTLNHDLVTPGYLVEDWQAQGYRLRHQRIRQCHYTGYIYGAPGSHVAMSNCHGLHGMFATHDEEYFVEPLWNSTNNIDSEEHYHVVYKKSSLKTIPGENHCGVSDKSNEIPHWWIPRSPMSFNELLKPHHHGYHHKDKWRTRRRGKRSVSKERHVEALVVVDKMMVGYHGKEEVEPYVLTIMNIVARLYHDASIGNAINIRVTRLVLLSEDQPQLEISHHADKSLESFCRWQHKIKPDPESTEEKDQGVAHHDNAILITRYDICTYKNQPCGTLGLAPVAGMCEPDRSCNINEDIGLASAFTIAHEIGHNFGMQHDGAGNSCGTPGHEPAKIMAAQLTKNTEPFSWSTCSRSYITGFLDSGRGKCLENPPPDLNFEYPTDVPGVAHTADEQCHYQYGSRSHQCKFGEVCRELWCIGPDERCVTNSIPAAEGTACATIEIKDGWCYRGECKEKTWQPKVLNGGWGTWSEWGDCSRTCGGGVESSMRSCDSPNPQDGGRYCIGERRRYRSCNIQGCPINSTDFREVQCRQYNEVPFRGKYYKWKPFSGVGQVKPCALNCLAVGYNFYTERAPKVIDGTRCFPDSLNMCINGECQHVGCDGILASDAVEDRCRVCGGDGSTCEIIKGQFDVPLEKKSDSYQEVARIPQGAVHIKIAETTMSKNYLALKSAGDKYYINGAWTIDWPRKFEVANTIFHYERPTDQPESLTAMGPTSEDLVVMILLQEQNFGITYQYNMAISNTSHNGTEFVWQLLPWSECSHSCARGISRSVAVCVRKDDRSIVKNKYCVMHLKPTDKVNYCNEQPCPPEWRIGDWTECSKTCGGGVKSRSVLCMKKVDPMEDEVMGDDDCLTSKPKSEQHCNIEVCPPHWATDGWTRCHPSCGPGEKKRNVYCVSAEGHYMHEHNCDAEKKPIRNMECNDGQCPPPDWVTGAWGECSAKCGQGQQRRNMACRTYTGEPSTECSSKTRPHDTRICQGPCIPDEENAECKDVNKVAYCPLVLKFNFCNRPYFRQMCCKTCTEAGF